MKVLYDSEAFTGQRFGGISGYFNQLITGRGSLFDYEVSGKVSNNIYVSQFSNMKPFFENTSFRGKLKLMKLINRLDDRKHIKKENYDVFHPTYYEAICFPDKKPVIITAHDFNSELLPKYFPNQEITQFKRTSFKRADRIICISENTRKDLLRLFPEIPEQKTVCIYHGITWKKIEPLSEEEKRNHPYILFTGGRTGYKNFERFIKSVSSLLNQYDLNLICTGHSFTDQENALFDALNITNRIIWKFARDESKLQELYRKALLFVFPSLYEGFGFPILEAFSAGCPVVLSNCSCFPEIAGEGGLYFDPQSEESIHETVQLALTNQGLRSSLVANGYRRLNDFSVERMIQETAEVYRSVL